MNVLIVHWGAYTHADILLTFTKHHIRFKVMEHKFKDKNIDDYFSSQLAARLSEAQFDAVFSVNYFPIIAKACASHKVKYLAWCYDCPLNVYNIEETLGFETNYLFLFDRIQVKRYRNFGFDNVYHLPLAINPERLNAIRIEPFEEQYYQSTLSFVGQLYNSSLPEIMAPLDDYYKGYLNAIVNTQLKVYGQYFVEDLLTDEIVSSIADQFPISITKEQLAYSLATYITYNERLILFKQLSDKYPFKLYSRDNHPLLSNIIQQGYVQYFSDMPKVFRATQINLNVTVKNTQSGIPLRVLDILGSGGFLLSNYQPEVAEYFIPDTDFVYYESIEDAVEKVDFYLRNEDIRQEIAKNGCKKCQEEFNYSKQFSYLFQTAGLYS